MKNLWIALLMGWFIVSFGVVQAQEQTGKQLYMQHCAQCHGEGLDGGNAQSLIDGIWQYGSARGYRHRNIKFGIPHVGMPAYQETLSDEAINRVLDYIDNVKSEKRQDKPNVPLDLLDRKSVV